MAQYILMNKNISLATVTLSDAGYLTDILAIHTPEAFPIGIFTEQKAQLLDSFNQWWRSRIIPSSRDGLRYVLHIYDVDFPTVLSKRSLGLSLSDQYWLKPEGGELV